MACPGWLTGDPPWHHVPMACVRTLAVFAVVSAVVMACGHDTARTTPPKSPSSAPTAVSAPPVCAEPTAVPAVLSTRDKLAQLLMVGVRDIADAKAVVANYHVGGIMIGSQTDLTMMTDGALAALAGGAGPLPLAVSVDEEGGRVSRLKSLIGRSPSARELVRSQSVDQVYNVALERGRQMKGLGITIDLAPVVDITDAPDDTVIGERSFSADPDVVTSYAGAYARGLRDAGLVPVLKHFPGHGHASGDSHTGSVTTPPLSDLQNVDLVPYRSLVTVAPVGVMLGHLQVPGLTGDEPASLSTAAVQLLRTGTGYGGPPFDGPVFSDDLSSMGAVSDRYDLADAVLHTLQAGTDVALWVTTAGVPAVLDRLEKALAAGELTMPAVDKSVVRVATIKGHSSVCAR